VRRANKIYREDIVKKITGKYRQEKIVKKNLKKNYYKKEKIIDEQK
jgi:hypothetical protein